MFEALTDGARIELRLINRGAERKWWCGPGSMSSWVEVETVAPNGSVSATMAAPIVADTDDGFTWSLAPDDTLRLSVLDVALDDDDRLAVVALDGNRLVVAPSDEVRVRLRPPPADASRHACIRRAKARWYAASAYRAELPWAPSGAPLHRVFPSHADDIDDIGALTFVEARNGFHLRASDNEGLMR